MLLYEKYLKTAEASQMSRVSLLRNACFLGIAWGRSIYVLGNYKFPLIFQGARILSRLGE